ncbi:MAG: ACT domain-containing protein [Saprospiraceae bacterium]
MQALDYLNNGKVLLWADTYSIIKARQPVTDCFAMVTDYQEITVIQRTDEVDENNVEEREDGYVILTFDMVLPFELTGFLAEVAAVLAEAEIAIFAISGFSTDHVLVKEADLEEAVAALERLGAVIVRL